MTQTGSKSITVDVEVPEGVYTVKSESKLSPGKHTIKFDFKYDGGGIGKGGNAIIYVDGNKTADVGIDLATPVVEVH